MLFGARLVAVDTTVLERLRKSLAQAESAKELAEEDVATSKSVCKHFDGVIQVKCPITCHSA